MISDKKTNGWDLSPSEKMTSLEIAEITGKQHCHVIRDIQKMEVTWAKICQSKFGLTYYTDQWNRPQPMYELTKTECLYVATQFNDEARARLVLRWERLETERQQQSRPMTPAEQLLANAQMLVEYERRMVCIEQDVHHIKAHTITRPDYYTVAGYATLRRIAVGLQQAAALGSMASRMCRMRGLPMEETPDPRFGRVKMYPAVILAEVFMTIN